MWNQIKHWLAKGIFRNEFKKIDIERQAFIKARESMEKQVAEYRAFTQSRTMTDMVREQLNGFDFSKVKGDLLSEIPPDQLPNYLDEALTIMDGDVFPYVVEYAKRNQIDVTINEANSIEAVNFGRATLAGVSLIVEAMESLVTEYDERHKSQEPFDKHSAT